MITTYQNTRFTHPDYSYGGTNYTEYLLGAVGLKVNAEIQVQISWGTLSTNLRFTAGSNTIERLDGVSDFLADGFRVNDTVVITGTVSNNTTGTITAINSDGTIMTITPAAPLVNETVVSSVQGDKEITSIDFYPNLIENSQDFGLFNLTDRETEPHYYADTISNDSGNPTIMTVGSNSKGWVTPADRATVYRSAASTTTNQVLVINHTFTITPIFIANWLENLQNLVPPTAGPFKDRLCLKYVYTVDGKFTTLDPTIVHTTDGNITFPDGQTGWFNEFVNGRPSVWVKESILYSDNATGEGLTGIDYCKVVDVDCILQGQSGVTETRYILHVMYLPLNESQYINTATNYKTNFIYERAVIIIGGGTAQGENTGDYHFLKNVTITTLAATRVKFEFQVDFSETLIDLFDELDADNRNYLIFITASSNL